MAFVASETWSPTTTSLTFVSKATAGIPSIKSVQITNNTSYSLYVNNSSVPPTGMGDAKFVLPARATASLPLASADLALRIVAAPTSLDYVSIVYSTEDVAPQVYPGVQASQSPNSAVVAWGSASFLPSASIVNLVTAPSVVAFVPPGRVALVTFMTLEVDAAGTSGVECYLMYGSISLDDNDLPRTMLRTLVEPNVQRVITREAPFTIDNSNSTLQKAFVLITRQLCDRLSGYINYILL